MSGDPFAPIAGAASASEAPAKATWSAITPVPGDAPAAPASHFKLGKPTTRWTYRDAAGELIGHVCRFDPADGKVFRPLTYGRRGDGAPEWRWESWPTPRPLYCLDRLAQKPDAVVLVTEGEKAADAATRLLPAMVVVTSPNGSKAANSADWSALRGRRVVVWPDADVAGLSYAQAVAKAAIAAGAISASIVSPPAGCKVGWDAADAVTDGWDQARTGELVAAAKPADSKPPKAKKAAADDGDDTEDGGKRISQSTVILRLTEFAEFWHDADETAYATFPVNGHRENAEIRSPRFRRWISGLFYKETGGAIRSQALEDAIRILEARAVNDGALYEPFLRTGHHDSKIYVDLCDGAWRAVEIGKNEIKIVDGSPVKFMRSPASRPLPEPEVGESIDRLKRFLNTDAEDFKLVVAWLVAALRPTGPYPILVVNGEQGTGKSMFCRIIRALVDPRAAPNRGAPKEDRDLVVSAGKSWIMTFDNLSYLADWLSDALCRLATGSGFATRTLHSDRDETIFEAARPIILNGIESLTNRADLASRAITVQLRPIEDDQRRSEKHLWAEFEKEQPYIIGALLDGVRSAIANIDSVTIEGLPRMADFTMWATAAERGLGWTPGTFRTAYDANQNETSEATFEADTVAVAIESLIKAQPALGWEGNATQLLAAINTRVSVGGVEARSTDEVDEGSDAKSWRLVHAPNGATKAKDWPQSAKAMGNRLVRAAPLLRRRGFIVEKRRSTDRLIVLKRMQQDEPSF
jgi:putative DNA primase/helicase